jgi:cytochrome oxidase Cu insertion factor (SCO1/SenC/PrrC family)
MNWLTGVGALAVMAAMAIPVRAEDPAQPEAPKEPLKVGDKAPDFKLKGTDGKEYTLKQFQGKSAVAIAWYPKALTGG